MTGYPLDQLYEEVASLAYHFHWPLQEILELDHTERACWLAQVSRMAESEP